MTQKVICRVAWSKKAVREFTKEVNAHLMEGWTCRDLSIVTRWCGVTCIALLESDPDSMD